MKKIFPPRQTLWRMWLCCMLIICWASIAAAVANEPAARDHGPPDTTGTHRPTIQLTPEEQVWLDSHPLITVSNEFDWPPFDFAISGTPKVLALT